MLISETGDLITQSAFIGEVEYLDLRGNVVVPLVTEVHGGGVRPHPHHHHPPPVPVVEEVVRASQDQQESILTVDQKPPSIPLPNIIKVELPQVCSLLATLFFDGSLIFGKSQGLARDYLTFCCFSCYWRIQTVPFQLCTL